MAVFINLIKFGDSALRLKSIWWILIRKHHLDKDEDKIKKKNLEDLDGQITINWFEKTIEDVGSFTVNGWNIYDLTDDLID